MLMAGALGGDEPLVSEVSELDAVPDRFNGFIVTDHIERRTRSATSLVIPRNQAGQVTRRARRQEQGTFEFTQRGRQQTQTCSSPPLNFHKIEET